MNEPTPQDFLELHALADGRLSGLDKDRILRLMEAHPQLQTEFDAILSLKRTVSEGCSRLSNDEAWATCKRRLEAIEKTKKAENFVGKYAWGLCALFFVAIFAGGLINRRGNNTLYTGDVASMASSLVPIGLPSSQSPDSVQQFVNEKTGGAPIDLSQGRLQLLSVMQGVRDGKLVTMFNFAHKAGPLSLIVVPNTQVVEGMKESAADRQFCHGIIGRLYCVSWVDKGFALLLLAHQDQRTTDDVQAIASMICIRR